MRSRAILLTVSLLAGMATVGPEPVAAATPEERPDIIVILIDDMPGIDDRVLRRLPNIPHDIPGAGHPLHRVPW